jgi:hypothetical protein
MKTTLPCKVSKTPVHPLGSSVPGPRSEPVALLAKTLPAPSSNNRPQPKPPLPSLALTGKSPRIGSASSYPSIQTSNGNLALFNQNCAAAHFLAKP